MTLKIMLDAFTDGNITVGQFRQKNCSRLGDAKNSSFNKGRLLKLDPGFSKSGRQILHNKCPKSGFQNQTKFCQLLNPMHVLSS